MKLCVCWHMSTRSHLKWLYSSVVIRRSRAEALTPNKSLGRLTHYLRGSWVWMHCSSQVCSGQTMLHAECDLQGRDQPLVNQQSKTGFSIDAQDRNEWKPQPESTHQNHRLIKSHLKRTFSTQQCLRNMITSMGSHNCGPQNLLDSRIFQGKIKSNGKWLILHVKGEPSCYNSNRARWCLMRVDLAMNTLTTKLWNQNPSVPTICPVAPLGATLKAAYPSSTPSQRLRSTSSACRMKVVKSFPAPWSKRNTEAQVPVCDTTMHMYWPS